MRAQAATGLTLDTGALLALDHPGKALAMQARLVEARRRGGTICPRQRHHAIVTSDPDDIARIDAAVPRVQV